MDANLNIKDRSVKSNSLGQKLPTYLKLDLVFQIVAFVGVIMFIVAFVMMKKNKDNIDYVNRSKSIIYTCLTFFGIGYLFGLIYSIVLWSVFKDANNRISLLIPHYILNFIPIVNAITFITAIIILRRHEYEIM